jgi:phosphoserine phosphatase
LRKLALMDLEGTLTDFEFWEEIAQGHEREKELKELLERGLSGGSWYDTFLERVKLLVGTPKERVEEVATKILDRIKPEAITLVNELKKRGFVTMIVSGGFEEFVEPVANALGVDDFVAQKFIYHNNEVVGVLPVFKEKGEVIEKVRPWFDFIFAIGDGFNDLNMLKRADVGVAVGKRAQELASEAGVLAYSDLRSLIKDLLEGKLGEALR